MFHAGFVVHQYISIVISQLIHRHGQVLVSCTVAAGTVRLAHDQQVKTDFLYKCLMYLHFHVLIPGDMGRDVAL